jgi:hypothetical protein
MWIDQIKNISKSNHTHCKDLRLALLEQLNGYESVKWGHQLVSLNDT